MAQGIHARAYGALRGAMALACGALLVLATGCSRPADEQALRDAIEAMQAAAEERDASALIDHLAGNFAGEGGLDRDRLRRMLVVQFMRNQRVGVTLGPIETRIEGERAEARFTAVLTGFENGLLPVRADGYRIVTGWRIEDGRWVMERASWE
ncbi:nuclear transport factor 2 family protein [Pseudomarimonas salicorniae]|uniref:Nuclear transport factor 2 family protein n=1 Tax=Pseudomarimonas salicorniae TaxID=2933270 RepID=A0ABT0GJX6_9GAMM|nr:nuclear transport factor 2 family protein [Lysobacter sp. CAU 1642]MCK7594847.1 nuclear transport factor 2 family protein [Lysobacter sp. CAU 1642]